MWEADAASASPTSVSETRGRSRELGTGSAAEAVLRSSAVATSEVLFDGGAVGWEGDVGLPRFTPADALISMLEDAQSAELMARLSTSEPRKITVALYVG